MLAFAIQNYNPEGIASCFTEDGIWDGGENFGVSNGRSEIYNYFADANDLVTFAVHYTTNPLIEVNGDEATRQWHLWQPMVMKEDNQAVWYMAQYSEQYVRQEGKWLIQTSYAYNKIAHTTRYAIRLNRKSTKSNLLNLMMKI